VIQLPSVFHGTNAISGGVISSLEIVLSDAQKRTKTGRNEPKRRETVENGPKLYPKNRGEIEPETGRFDVVHEPPHPGRRTIGRAPGRSAGTFYNGAMCGRFALTSPPDVIAALFDLVLPPDVGPRYNIAPTQPVGTVRQGDDGRTFDLLRWGLVPPWAKDISIGSRMINARSETAATKPAFRSAMKRRRCLIPADGFYEWQPRGSEKQPFFIHAKDGGLLVFAGLWESWVQDDEEIESCTILTTEANATTEAMHDRMPVILAPSDFDAWLDPGRQDAAELAPLLRPAPDDLLDAYPVSRRVNKPAFDDPACLQREGGLFD
jgi:putative SOS response-associated peptidase YedK